MDACRGSLTYARDAVGRGRVSAARVSPHLSVSARPADILPSDLLARRVRAGSGAAAAHHRRITTAELYSTAAELRTENESNAARHPSRTQAAARAGPGAAALLCGRGCPAVAQPVAGRARARAGSGRTQQGVRPRFRGTAADVGQSRARPRLQATRSARGILCRDFACGPTFSRFAPRLYTLCQSENQRGQLTHTP